jgi:uncharacterized iron-regulated membrane protein
MHRHSGIGLLTPATVHAGQASQQVAARQEVLDAAYAAHPERFVAECVNSFETDIGRQLRYGRG